MRAAPIKSLNPFFARRIDKSNKKKKALAIVGGWPYFTTFHDILRAGVVVTTPLTVERLRRVADAVGFPREEIFLEEAAR